MEYKHQPGLVDGINLKSSLEEIYSLPIILSKLVNRLSLPVLCGCGDQCAELANHIPQLNTILATPTGAPKVKLYTDEEGYLKGDGLCCYLKVGVAHILAAWLIT